MASRRMHAGYLQMSELAIGGQGVQGSFGSACFHPFFALCRSALVGAPRTKGRQPTQNGELHVFSRFSHSAIPRWLASRAQRDANQPRMAKRAEGPDKRLDLR